METYFPNIPENNLQILLIEKMAKKLNLAPEALSEHWIDMYSPTFREIWESGVRDIDAIEEEIYKVEPLQSNYADMISAILIFNPDSTIK